MTRPAPASPDSELVDTREAARRLGLSPPALIKWRRDGKGPAYYRFGYAIRYRATDLDAFLAAHKVTP